MGKSTISMAIFNSKLLVYQRVTPCSLQAEDPAPVPQDPTCFPAPPWSQDSPKTSRRRPCRRSLHHSTRRKTEGHLGLSEKNMGEKQQILMNHHELSKNGENNKNWWIILISSLLNLPHIDDGIWMSHFTIFREVAHHSNQGRQKIRAAPKCKALVGLQSSS